METERIVDLGIEVAFDRQVEVGANRPDFGQADVTEFWLSGEARKGRMDAMDIGESASAPPVRIGGSRNRLGFRPPRLADEGRGHLGKPSSILLAMALSSSQFLAIDRRGGDLADVIGRDPLRAAIRMAARDHDI